MASYPKKRKGLPMNESRTIAKPILKSILYTLLILLFPIGAGVVITIMQLTDVSATLVQAAFFALAALCGFFILNKSVFTLQNIGYRIPQKNSSKKLLWYSPLILIEILPILNGWQDNLNAPIILSTLLLMACVGLAEELYFRGLILQSLKTRNVRLAIVLSSMLFSIGHLSNLAGGADLTATLLQVLFALLFGLVAAEIAVQSKSILLVSIWHFVHNTISTLTATETLLSENILLAAQCSLLLLYSIYLWTQKK